MSHPNPSTALASVVVDELFRNGIDSAIASPGSRSTALVLALEKHPGVRLVMQLDERSAGFRALGSSVADGTPAVVVTTSGSAVANLLPAVAEADRAAVPMIVLTADRPGELVHRRANQTMDHLQVFDGFVRDQTHLGPASSRVDDNESWRESVSRAVLAATGEEAPPGPVHLNVSFEEPTVPETDDGRVQAEIYEYETDGALGGRPWLERIPLLSQRWPEIPGLGDRVVVVAGRGFYDINRLAAITEERGVPLAVTALSGGRGRGMISSYHHILVDGVPDLLRPSAVVIAGQLSPGDRLIRLTQLGVPVVHVDRWGLFSDPAGTMTLGLTGDPVALVETIEHQEPEWNAVWLRAGSKVRSALTSQIESLERLCGPGVSHYLNQINWQSLVVGSSLAIRDVDAYLDRSGWVHSNRGVSGIDGFASTAIGVADVRPGTLGLVGDLSFLHDSNAFLAERVPPLVLIVVDNNGGGLFDLLPQATMAPGYERLFVTPHDRDLADLARFHRLRLSVADSPGQFVGVVNGELASGDVALVKVPVDRSFDLQVRKSLDLVARGVLGAV